MQVRLEVGISAPWIAVFNFGTAVFWGEDQNNGLSEWGVSEWRSVGIEGRPHFALAILSIQLLSLLKGNYPLTQFWKCALFLSRRIYQHYTEIGSIVTCNPFQKTLSYLVLLPTESESPGITSRLVVVSLMLQCSEKVKLLCFCAITNLLA